jgi:ABC-type Mn2+/Zn2+ transport system permease subunit
VLEPFTLPFVQRGIVEVLVLALGAGVIGTWIVMRGLAFFAHAVGTATFPGLVLAQGLGFGVAVGASGTGAAVAIGVGVLSRREGGPGREDSVTALVLVAALAAGVVLASDVFSAGGNVESLLFGSLLLVDGGDVWFSAAASAVVLGLALVLEPRWLVVGFDSGSAPALGVRSWVPDAALLGAITLLAVSALATLGSLLATALLVVPAATTRLLCSRLRSWQLATVALIAGEGVVGLWLGVELNAPAGAAIAVLAGAVFAAVVAARLALRARAGRRGAAPRPVEAVA